MLISYIVSSYMDWWSIRYVLHSLLYSAEKAGVGYEIIVVVPRRAVETRKRIKWFTEETGVDVAVVDDPGVSLPLSRDIGFRRSRGDIIVFGDGDIGFSPWFTRRLLTDIEEHDLVAPSLRIVPLDPATASIRAMDEVVESYTSVVGRERPSLLPPARVYRRKVLIDMGGYPVATRYYAEDRVATAMAVERGHRYRYDPGLVMYKLDDPGYAAYMKKYTRYGWGIVCDIGRAAKRILRHYLALRRLTYINTVLPAQSMYYAVQAMRIHRGIREALRIASTKWLIDAWMLLGEIKGVLGRCRRG